MAFNANIDFVIVTDLECPSPLPANVRLVGIKLDEITDRLSKIVGAPLRLERLHIICDYRPFYALLFPELVTGYDYWGYCDMDLIFGDLTPLIEATRLGCWDFISPWHYTAGHCSLLRNVERVNRVALNTPNLIQRLNMSGNTFIDEGNLSEVAVRAGGFKFCVLDDASAEWAKAKCFIGATVQPGGTLSAMPGLFMARCTPKQIVVFDQLGQPHEVLYLHFMGMKEPRYWRDFNPAVMQDFSFTPWGYVPQLLPPEAMQTFNFRLKCFCAQFPARLYSFFRGLAPLWLLKSLKQWHGCLGKQRRR